MATGKELDDDPHVAPSQGSGGAGRLDAREVASASTPRRGSLLCKNLLVAVMMACGGGPAFATFREWVPSDYVPGAVAFWDAIDNAGVGAHDPSAATWKNLGTGGTTYDLAIKDAVWCDGNSLSNGINTLAAYGSTTISYTTSEFAIDNYNVGGEDSNARWIFSNGIILRF